MRVLIQRCKQAKVKIDHKEEKNISQGMVVLVGIEIKDSAEDIYWLVNKIKNLRIFNDDDFVMNRSIIETKGDLLVISQFTLHASTKKGNRPSYIREAKSPVAIPLYNLFVNELKKNTGLKIETGKFGADMQVHLINDGPVTIFIDSKNRE